MDFNQRQLILFKLGPIVEQDKGMKTILLVERRGLIQNLDKDFLIDQIYKGSEVDENW